MSGQHTLRLGFVPLNDGATLIAAHEKGFFEAEGLTVELSREVSWATVRDKVAVGALDGAHMLAPLALAAAIGSGSEPAAIVAPFALNLDGAAVTLSTRLSGVLGGRDDGIALARLVERRRAQGASGLTFAVVYPYSVHNYLLRGWMAQAGIDPDRHVRLTVAPPSRMAELLAEGVIEGFCAGEPWNAAAEASGAGRVAVRASQYWGHTPDKVFGVTETWAAANPAMLGAVLRALLAAAAWAEAPANRAELVQILARPDYVGAAPEVIAAGLDDLIFHANEANAPKVEHGLWLLQQMARWRQVPAGVDTAALAARVYRPDLYAAALDGGTPQN